MIKKCLSLVSAAALLASLTLVAFAAPVAAVSGAVSTTDNVGWADTYDSYVNVACFNGQGVNCNIYADKRDVWLSGLPVTASLGAGDYFFAILSPGGQPGPNDCSSNNANGVDANLSDVTPPCADPVSSGTGAGDAYGNRTFSVDDNGIISYGGTHDFDLTNNKIQVFPYDDTPNPGGVYILAVCSLAGGTPVDPHDCKYDAFKVDVNGGPCPDCGGQGFPLGISKDAAGSYTDTFGWTIDKGVDTPSVKTAGGASTTANYTVTVTKDGGAISSVQVTGTITVTNTNLFDVTGIAVTDQLNDGADPAPNPIGSPCSVTGGSSTVPGSGSTTFDYSCDLGSTLPAGSVYNTTTATWPAQAFEDAGSASFTTPTAIDFTANNVDDCVTVNDTNPAGPQNDVICASKTYNYSGTVSGDAGTCTNNDNTATVSDGSGTLGSDSTTVADCQGADLTVTKTANPTYTRTYNWTIRKTVDEAAHIDQLSGTVTLHYHVTASETGFTDSAWKVSGTITVTNPNDWEDVTLSNVTDTVDNGGVCTVDKSGGMTVAKSSTKDFPYECTYSSKPTYNTTAHNKATVTWDATAASTPTGTADTGNVDFSFTNPTTSVNKTIHVTDTYNGGSPVALGTLTAVDTTPYTTATYNLSKTVNVVPNSCVTVNNTGTITETNQTSTVSNTICGRSAVGALTMGFWQNKNGQGIITGQAKTGTCPSATWLRNYAPFQDLASASTCAQTATYVYNVIKAANASGASMNAMLKAQMLATALDVYFSDPALGGNKIGAPTPIGGTKIDLTKICKMIDGSGGTGTCSGTYQNAGPAFGGATCLTVSAILTYEASQSNAGGSVWYGQVKATQELAKNVDDSINNQVAFAC